MDVRGKIIAGAVALAGAAVALTVNGVVPVVSALTAAVLIGVLVGARLPTVELRWATRAFLRAGVVLLGLQLSLADVTALGPGMLAAVVVTVVAGFAGTIVLARVLGVARGLGLLVATGFSICGASAIAAMEGVAQAEEEDVAAAVTLVTLYGTAAIGLLPLVGAWLGLPAEVLGAWAGLSVHEVAQVVAAASPAGAAAVAAAVVVKLTRVVLLAPLVAGVGLVRRADSAERPPVMPLFVAGFLVLVVVRTVAPVPAAVLSTAQTVTTVLFAGALFGLGCAVRPLTLLRTGRQGLLLGALSTLLLGVVSLAAVLAV